MHSVYGKRIPAILREAGFEEFFLEGGSGFLEIAIINFTSRFLFDSLFTCRLKNLSLVIFRLCSNLFSCIKWFF